MSMDHITTLYAGQAVPEWLFTQSPKTPDAVPGELTALQVVDVYLRGETYWVIPTDLSMPQFAWANAQHIVLSAGNRRVCMPIGFHTMEVDGTGFDINIPDSI